MILFKNKKKLINQSLNLVQDCQVSLGQRSAAYRSYGAWMETGRAAGGLALANMLYGHVDRLGSHLFSPSDLRFSIDYENIYPAPDLAKAEVAARIVSREWERKNIDMLFGHGVKESLPYASYFLKQLAGKGPDGTFQFQGAILVPPWAMGVYNESENDLSRQEAFVHTTYLTRSQVWQMVRDLPDAEKLFRRITATSNRETGIGVPVSFMHQVLSTAVLNVSLQNATQPQPGGIVQLTTDPNFATLGPQVAPNLFAMHELWVRDDAREQGYTTIRLIEPDILVSPLYRHINLFIDHGVDDDGNTVDPSDDQPFTLIQSNYVPGYFWGRSELVDLLQLQEWLTTHLDDVRRIMGQQVDKLLAFPGYDGLTDELYGQFRAQGYMGMPPGSSVSDLTPKMPEHAIELVGQILMLMDKASGFPPLMSGQGEAGVRSGVHADTLMKTGSPRLRDRSLLAERQCALAGDITLSALQAKDAHAYWTDPEKGDTDFLLSQLHDDRRITVDAHSSSPVFADDNAQLLAYALKAHVIGPEDFIEDMPFAHKDQKLQRLKHRQEAEQQLIKEHPEILTHGKHH